MRNCRIFRPEKGGAYDRHKIVPKSDIYKQDFLRPRAAEIFRLLSGSPTDALEEAIFGERLERNGHFGLRRRPKATNAPSEMAIFERKRGENETRPERNGHFGRKRGQK